MSKFFSVPYFTPNSVVENTYRLHIFPMEQYMTVHTVYF